MDELHQAGIEARYLEGEMVQAKRTEAVKHLNDGSITVLVATDIATRGLDIDDISHIFNFDLPRTADIYLHRIGRTARAGKGTAITLVEAHDHPLLGKISRYLNEPLTSRIVDELRPTTKAQVTKPTISHRKKYWLNAKRKRKRKNRRKKLKYVIEIAKISVNAVNLPVIQNQKRQPIAMRKSLNGPISPLIIICSFA